MNSVNLPSCYLAFVIILKSCFSYLHDVVVMVHVHSEQYINQENKIKCVKLKEQVYNKRHQKLYINKNN